MRAPADPEPWTTAFRREREAAWHELETMLRTIERAGARTLPEAALARLPVLYRAALSSLTVARATCLDLALLDYLEALTARAWLAVYGPQRSGRAVAWQFVAAGLPRAVRAAGPQLLVAAVALLLGHGVAQVLVAGDLSRYWYFVDEHLAGGRDPTATTAELRATLFDTDQHSSMLAAFAAFLFSNNAQVALLAFGLGLLAGVPVLLLMFSNGMTLGAMTALFHDRGLAVEWWSWILPHGLTEITAVVLAGGAGLLLTDALLFPGRCARLQALARRGRHAGTLVLGALTMLFLAGVLEGV
ncbi:MAG TPA: stage II sporulation protein M, partial [Planctomycetota bacterium]|nr:stage II sporulation protein M [Planctomycetota bacterium]